MLDEEEDDIEFFFLRPKDITTVASARVTCSWASQAPT